MEKSKSECFLLYMIMLVVIVMNLELAGNSISFADNYFSLNFLVYPWLFLIMGLFYYRYGFKKAITLLTLSSLFLIFYYFWECLFLTGYSFNLLTFSNNIIAYIITQIITLLILNKFSDKINLFGVIILSIVVISLNSCFYALNYLLIDHTIAINSFLFYNLILVLIEILITSSTYILAKKN